MSTVTVDIRTGKSGPVVATLAGLKAQPVGAVLVDKDGDAWQIRPEGMAGAGIRGAFNLEDLGDAAMVMTVAPFRVVAGGESA